MKTDTAGLKNDFREGRREQAIAACEALCVRETANLEARRLCAMMHAVMHNYGRSLELLQQVRAGDPDNADVLFNIGMCERELKNVTGAAQAFKAYTGKFPGHPDGWASLAECSFQLNDFSEGIRCADRAIQLDPVSVPAWTVRGNSQKASGLFADAVASFTQAIQLAPKLAALKVHRGDTYEMTGNMELAVADYKAALALNPADAPTLKKATLCLLQLDRGGDGIALCRDVLKADPDNLSARLGAEWLLGQMVPLWHVPMMNEEERNLPYYEGLRAAITPDKTVFEIGTGSGLLAMMAAKLGARSVVTCEAVGLVADTARKIIANNNYQDRVKVLAKPSYAVQLGEDLPEKADILVHEIFSSELLGEHVLPALEDAKARLLKPGGQVLPARAGIMIALVSGEGLGKELHIDEAFGFDLRAFNAITPKKRPVYREDLPRVLLSGSVEAFDFDFNRDSSFPAGKKRIDIPVTQSGLCYGVIQWIRFDFGHGIVFENDPARVRPVASWQHTIYRFDRPMQLEVGAVVSVNAMHDRSRPWFEVTP